MAAEAIKESRGQPINGPASPPAKAEATSNFKTIPTAQEARNETPPPARTIRPGVFADYGPSPASTEPVLADIQVGPSNRNGTSNGNGVKNTSPASNLQYVDDGSSSGSRAAATPSSQTASKGAIAREVSEIVSKVQNHATPLTTTTLDAIDGGYIKASCDEVREAFLADPDIQQLLANIAKEIFTRAPNKIEPINPAERAVYRLNLIIGNGNLHPTIRNALLSQVFNSTEFIDILHQVKIAPKGQMTLDEFVKNDNIMGLPSYETRFALLFQATFYPTELVVQRLESLAGRDDFRSWDLADQQRGAKLCAFAAQYKGDKRAREILDNSWNYILSGKVKLAWYYTKLGTSVYNNSGILVFNRDEVAAGNWLILEAPSLEGDDEANLALEDPANAVSHALHNDSYTLRSLYRAEYVGLMARYGLGLKDGLGLKEWNKRKAYAQISWLISLHLYASKDNPYREISDAFYNKDPDTIAFIAEVIGLDPKKATFFDIIRFDAKFQNNPKILSDKEPAFVPIDDNLDNHFEP